MLEAQSARVRVPEDHPAFAGHFPGNPLLPGVVLLAEVLEVLLAQPNAAVLLGAQPTLSAVKFLAAVRPGAELEIRWMRAEGSTRTRFEVWRHAPGDGSQGVLASSGQIEAGPPNPA